MPLKKAKTKSKTNVYDMEEDIRKYSKDKVKVKEKVFEGESSKTKAKKNNKKSKY